MIKAETIKSAVTILVLFICTATTLHAANCTDLPSESQLRAALIAAPAAGGEAGGLFHGKRMWAAVVNRD